MALDKPEPTRHLSPHAEPEPHDRRFREAGERCRGHLCRDDPRGAAEAVKAMAAKAREENEALAKRLDALEGKGK